MDFIRLDPIVRFREPKIRRKRFQLIWRSQRHKRLRSDIARVGAGRVDQLFERDARSDRVVCEVAVVAIRKQIVVGCDRDLLTESQLPPFDARQDIGQQYQLVKTGRDERQVSVLLENDLVVGIDDHHAEDSIARGQQILDFLRLAQLRDRSRLLCSQRTRSGGNQRAKQEQPDEQDGACAGAVLHCLPGVVRVTGGAIRVGIRVRQCTKPIQEAPAL